MNIINISYYPFMGFIIINIKKEVFIIFSCILYSHLIINLWDSLILMNTISKTNNNKIKVEILQHQIYNFTEKRVY